MEIVTYRDLKAKNSLLPVLDQAFGWPFNEREFNRSVRIDPRLKNGSVGFCGLEDGKVVSFVGVMDLTTQTLQRTKEVVGGIYGVATLPEYSRRGCCTSLFDVVHEHFEEKGYRFSFLNTGIPLVAYGMYKRLGYSDVYSYHAAYKAVEKKKAVPKNEKTKKPDLDRILSLYHKYTKDRVGFVVRDNSYLEFLVKEKWLTGKTTIVGEKGYVVFRKDPHSTRIQELVALSEEEADELLDDLENKARDVIVARAVVDKTLLRIYQCRGYTLLDQGYGIFMVKPLELGISFEKVYGDEFFQSQVDQF